MSAKPSRRVAVAMSGGVDSSVVVALLLREGCEVVGITLRLLEPPKEHGEAVCGGDDALESARRAAERLGVRHHVLDARQAFDDEVLRPCWAEYARGRTPNPCVPCNQRIKFGPLLRLAQELGAQHVATGHYVRIDRGRPGVPPALRRAAQRVKDQSYFLYALGADQLERSLFPLGGLSKDEVRALAADLELECARRPESQDACFVTEAGPFAESLRRRFGGQSRPGPILGPGDEVVGSHAGLHRYTVGQRRGLGVALGRPAWVRALDPDRAAILLTVAPEELRSREVLVDRVSLGPRFAGEAGGRWLVQLRSRHRAAAATVELLADRRASVRFEEPQLAVTPGQSAVFYAGDLVVGGGRIVEAR